MSIKKIFIFLIGIVLFNITKGQNIEFKEENFQDKGGFEKAVRNLVNGDKYYSQQKKVLYSKALSYYQKAQEFNPNNAALNFKIGYCYLYGTGASKSLEYLLKAKSLDSNVNDKMDYYIAYSYQFNMQFDNAINLYKLYLSRLSVEDKSKYISFVEDKIKECENGKELTKNNDKLKIVNLGDKINTVYDDYAPLLTKDENTIIFTSKRIGSTGGEKDLDDAQYYEDIYISKKSDGKWSYPTKISPKINTPSHEGSAGLSFDGKTLLIYKGLTNGGDIFQSKINDQGIWSVPKPLPTTINTPFTESSACFSPDGKYLYFTSSREDLSLGERDIFVSKLDSNGNWGFPRNLGATINTPFDEEGVYLHPDGKTLFFSSKGHNSIGGFDIFKSILDSTGKWSDPINLGYPINTADDELYPVVFGIGDSSRGYYSANKEDSYGGNDIYMFSYSLGENVITKDTVNIVKIDSNLVAIVDTTEPSNNFVNIDTTKNIVVINNTTDTTKNNIIVNNNPDTVVNKVVNNIEDTTKNIVVNNIPDTTTNKIVNNNFVDTTKNIIPNPPDTTTYEVIVTNNPSDTSKSDIIKVTPIVNNNQISDNINGVVFYVQVGASHKKMPYNELHTRYPGKLIVTEIQHEGWYKYIIGRFDKYSEARELKFNCGTWDAWVVTCRNGVRINVKEVLNLLSFYPTMNDFLNRL